MKKLAMMHLNLGVYQTVRVVSLPSQRIRGRYPVKFLLYYDVDEDEAINERKHAFVGQLVL